MTAESLRRISELKQLSSSIEKEYAGANDAHTYVQNTNESIDSLLNVWVIK